MRRPFLLIVAIAISGCTDYCPDGSVSILWAECPSYDDDQADTDGQPPPSIPPDWNACDVLSGVIGTTLVEPEGDWHATPWTSGPAAEIRYMPSGAAGGSWEWSTMPAADGVPAVATMPVAVSPTLAVDAHPNSGWVQWVVARETTTVELWTFFAGAFGAGWISLPASEPTRLYWAEAAYTGQWLLTGPDLEVLGHAYDAMLDPDGPEHGGSPHVWGGPDLGAVSQVQHGAWRWSPLMGRCLYEVDFSDGGTAGTGSMFGTGGGGGTSWGATSEASTTGSTSSEPEAVDPTG